MPFTPQCYIIFNTVLPAATTTAVGLRFYSRWRSGMKLGLDDWTILVCWVFCVILAGMGLGTAMSSVKATTLEEIPLEEYYSVRKIRLSVLLITHLVFALVKISVIAFFARLFQTAKFVMAAKGGILTVFLWMVLTFFITLFCARPVSSFWTTPPELEGTQYIFNIFDYLNVQNVIDIVFDIAILAMPIPVLKSLNLRLRKKFMAAGILLLGGFCLISSILRLHYGIERARESAVIITNFQLYSDANNIWAHFEAYFCVFTACLPTLGALIRSSRLGSRAASSMSVKNDAQNGYYTRSGATSSWSMRKDMSDTDSTTELVLVPPEATAKRASTYTVAVKSDEWKEFGNGIMVERSVSVTDNYESKV